MRKLTIILTIALCAAACFDALGDTGTYRILSYRVRLTPRSDGTVAIDYYQKWLVTGGHIPWITVGTPNSDFEITGYGGAASRASSASRGGWSGVRLDLDGDYRSGQTFEASFSIVQGGLFYASENAYRLDFTPGWYDRAGIDTLWLAVRFFARIETVTARPDPTGVAGDEMTWERFGLDAGERFTIRVSFPIELFPEGIAAGARRAGGRGSALPIVAAIALIVFVLFIVIASARLKKGRYTGGMLYYGGFFGAGRGGAGGRSGGGRSSGGGGGFGGASMSCACACVSCACACACAGGGGAGCSRKLVHSCPACDRKAAP